MLNLAGDVEMDSIIMEGHHLKAGSVAGVKNIRNPVDLARMVMDKVCDLENKRQPFWFCCHRLSCNCQTGT